MISPVSSCCRHGKRHRKVKRLNRVRKPHLCLPMDSPAGDNTAVDVEAPQLTSQGALNLDINREGELARACKHHAKKEKATRKVGRKRRRRPLSPIYEDCAEKAGGPGAADDTAMDEGGPPQAMYEGLNLAKSNEVDLLGALQHLQLKETATL